LLAAYPGDGLGEDPTWLPLDAIAEADAVLCDIRWNAGAIAALEAARRAGVPTVLDADLAPRESLQRLLELSDHAIFSERCLTDYAGTRDHHTALLEISQQTAAQLAVTLGEKGVALLRGGRLERIPAYAVSVRGTNGAGDVFHGAYALSIAEGSAAPEAATFANAAAAIKCSLGGGWTGMPNRSLVDNLMKANFHATVGG
jgi:sulfofructose kinase